MNDNEKAMAAAGGVLALGAGYLLTQGDSAAEAAEQLPVEVPEEAVDTVESWHPAYEGAEWGISENGVLYDDPESGDHNDETEDDANTSFEEIEEETGGAVDAEETAETYAPDTEGDTGAPSSGVVSDPGDSQVFGDAPEQENDDINDTGNLSDEDAAMWDRLANYDDADQLESDYDGGSSSTSSTSSTSDTSTDDSGSTWAETYDGGTDGLTIDENNDAGYVAPEW